MAIPTVMLNVAYHLASSPQNNTKKHFPTLFPTLEQGLASVKLLTQEMLLFCSRNNELALRQDAENQISSMK
jgi:hypothetical protein